MVWRIADRTVQGRIDPASFELKPSPSTAFHYSIALFGDEDVQ